MLRLTLLLCVGLYAALMIAGEDRGQLRPGLADAASKQSEPVAKVDLTPVVLAEAPLVTKPLTKPAAVAEKPVEKPVVAASEPEPYVEPERNLVTKVEEPVFSLASVGNEAVPATPAKQPMPEVADGGEGTIWYVNASSVNVRAQPTTDAEVVGKLASGEAAMMVQAVDDEWARIVIQGDGVEGFVAMRYLSAEAP
jgi:uncharacterized protein YgiM (DUF1202 family)